MQQYIPQYIETNSSKGFENLFVVSGKSIYSQWEYRSEWLKVSTVSGNIVVSG